MRRTANIAGREENIFEKVRKYLGMSIEEIAREVGVSTYTFWRWENSIIEQPSLHYIKKIEKLIKKKANEEFKMDFLKWVIYDKKIPIIGKTKEEIIKEIEKNQEIFMDSPIWNKVFKENPELKNLPFGEIFKKYTKDKLSYDGIFLLNSLPTNPPKRGRPRRIDKQLTKQNKNIKHKTQVKKTPREKHRHKNTNKNESNEGSDDESSHYKFDKDTEAKYNLIGLFDLLLKIDMRIKHKEYKGGF
ncbi:MAG: helix-turn-helix domain-containing protein [Candidatus Omnitrophica bacterium]|nr:helix-turn-helix domain-containing protein [Candidatus Omnitrophota bacterium]MCM8804394.1 helix-turn-helix domain-containing protein [Candidatus Omnitrophota bacterium]